MWELDHKESWVPKNWCFWTMELEKTLDCKEIKPVNPKGNQSWIFTGRTAAEAETPILWPLLWRTDSLKKTLMLGKIEGRRRRGWQRMRWLDGLIDSMNMNLSNLWVLVMDKDIWHAAVRGVIKSQALLNDWTEIHLWSYNYNLCHTFSITSKTFLLPPYVLLLFCVINIIVLVIRMLTISWWVSQPDGNAG